MGCSKCGCRIPGCQDVHKANLGIILEQSEAIDEAAEIFSRLDTDTKHSDHTETQRMISQWMDDHVDDDPTPWCHVCSARTALDCDCGPKAEND